MISIPEMEGGDEQFEEIQVSLQGTTVLKTPRVSRETIISVLQTHTSLIKSLKKDHSKLAFKVSDLENSNKENNRKLNNLTDDVEVQKKNVIQLFKLNDEFRKEMEDLGEQVAELYLLKKSINEQQAFLENLSLRYNKFSTEVGEFIANVGATINTVEESCKDTQFQLKELKDYVDHFADNLVLSSGQITVEVDAGFSVKPVSLTETLKLARTTLTEIEAGAEKAEEKMEQMNQELEAKAPDTVLFNVNTLERKVSTIEVHLRKEEEQGIGAIRKACEELSVSVQAIAMEMTEKIDRESVGFIVHEKYEEIVRYLQDALQSSLEDENRFKQKADEIQDMVILLTNSKADRTEIQHMQELMVKSEALLKKVGGQMNMKEKLKDLVSRKDLEALLELKVDKMEFDQQLQAVAAGSKRNRKLTSLAPTGGAPVVEDAIDAIRSMNNLNRKPVLNSASTGNLHSNTSFNNNGSNHANNNNNNYNNSNYNNHYIPTAESDMHDEDEKGYYDPSRTNVTHGGVGFTTEFPRIHNPTGTGRHPSGPEPVMAIGHKLGNTSPGRESGVEASASGAKKGDFGTFARKGKNAVTSSSLPSNVVPGAFRAATEAGRAGGGTSPERARTPGGSLRRTAGLNVNESGHLLMTGPNGAPITYQQWVAMNNGTSVPPTQQQWVSMGNDPNLYQSFVQQLKLEIASVNSAQLAADLSTQQGVVPDHTSFLQGPVVGGGFNTHSKNLLHKMPGANPVPDEDVEGKGLMLKGQDGHFYYQDLKKQ